MNPQTMTSEFMQLHYCDEELPPRNEWVVIVVVEVDHGQSTSSPLHIEIDSGYIMDDGNWSTINDWDEGQPWSVVAWARLPSESEIRKHVIPWKNEPKSNNCAMMGGGTMNEALKEELCGNGSIVKTVHADWEELVKMVHHAFAYGLESNDMTHSEVISDISFALDRFAKNYGLPEHDWDAEYEDLYAEEPCSD